MEENECGVTHKVTSQKLQERYDEYFERDLV